MVKPATLREWFDDFTAATGEHPEYVVFGVVRWGEPWGPPTGLIPWGDVPDEILDREFYDGYGLQESPSLCAWSPSWVLFTGTYDGAEWLEWWPRSPRDFVPDSVGGGS